VAAQILSPLPEFVPATPAFQTNSCLPEERLYGRVVGQKLEILLSKNPFSFSAGLKGLIT
jgi:hypothetical protein